MLNVPTIINKATLEKFFNEHQIDVSTGEKGFFGPCPVHGGDNPRGWFLYLNNLRPYWICFTHNCHETYGTDFEGLIDGIFNCGKEQVKVTKFEPVITKPEKIFVPKLNRSLIRKKLEIPAKYYLERGYSSKVLNKYDVGLCLDSKRRFYNRVIVPFYNDELLYLGCSARSIYEKCYKCKKHHIKSPECPRNSKEIKYSKWLHEDIKPSQLLYNYWYAKDFIALSRTIILVEGPGDVWRLEDNGIHNSVAILGSVLKQKQKLIIDASGAMNIISLCDNDEAGLKAAESIRKLCGDKYRLFFPKITEKDVGDLNQDKITAEIKPILEQLNV